MSTEEKPVKFANGRRAYIQCLDSIIDRNIQKLGDTLQLELDTDPGSFITRRIEPFLPRSAVDTEEKKDENITVVFEPWSEDTSASTAPVEPSANTETKHDN